ncbi:FAD/FMN-containing isoamyl alcohol oxidase MreA [Xylariaceae sp. FL1019]|nr:FAD/FMN-containing isoamyl alcohol oxidase MreA [Xylariaceae sp. FL1019]
MKNLVSHLPLLAIAAQATIATKDCRCFPGHDCWPTDETWSAFNASIGGNLIRTIPIGQVCHDPHYDEETCENLKSRWLDPEVHIDSSHSVQSGLFANASCDPMAPREEPCIGTYVQYSVAVNNADDISKTVHFANAQNIRLVIRNTAHDYLGKSTGAGAIAIWTSKLKDVAKLTYDGTTYKGDAIKMGAGVLAAEVSEYASKHGLVVMSGNCPTVGIGGGFIQGGGHGPLGSLLGMAADSALAFEVVTGTGELVVADADKNADLFWALRGGGGSTYGVVVSTTVKAYGDVSINFGSLMFTSDGLEEDRFYEAVAALYEVIPAIVDAGAVPIFLLTPQVFALQELIAPNMTETEVEKLLEPFIAKLEGIEYVKNVVPYKSWKLTNPNPFCLSDFDFQADALIPMTKQQANIFMGGSWLMPRSSITDQARRAEYAKTIKEIVKSGLIVQQLGFNMSKKPGSDIDNAVLPAWRDTLLHTVVGTLYNSQATPDENKNVLAVVHDGGIQKLANLAPESGAYMSEAYAFSPNWKKDFYGVNYDKLEGIKDKYDPTHLFYALTAVGSDYWVEQDDKRLCKRSSSSYAKDEL